MMTGKPIINLQASDIDGLAFPLAPLHYSYASHSRRVAVVTAQVSGGDIIIRDIDAKNLALKSSCRMQGVTLVAGRGGALMTSTNPTNLIKPNYLALQIINPDCVVICLDRQPVSLQRGASKPGGGVYTVVAQFNSFTP